MEKFLVSIEFRYDKAPSFEDDFTSISKKITIGVFDSYDEAAIYSNNALEIFEKHFKLNRYHNKKERFTKTGGCFGQAVDLITNLAYLETEFEFFAQITKLKFDDVEKTILEVIESEENYKEYLKRNNEQNNN